ncbi:MAG: PQQ-like beta-propeller repeat protein [Thermoplasmatales archaeon]|nr:MAG: PQQ-like beta-propeller repeat protein [Thermoplasmatales archaeon]
MVKMKYVIPILIVLLLLSSGFVGVSNTVEEQWVNTEDMVETTATTSNGPMDSPWSMYCHDTRHSGQSQYSTADNPGLEKWRFFLSDWMEECPVIDNDGTIYVMGGNRYFYAVYPDGTEKWKFKIDGVIDGSSPAIDEDGTIYVGVWGDYLYAINSNGTEKWKFNANGANIFSSPAIAEDGTVYFGTLWSLGDGGKIHAVNPDGTEKWRYQTGDAITSSPAIGNDGTIYIGSQDHYVYALYPNGTLRWRFKTGDWVSGSPSIGIDGTIYIGSYDDFLYALYPNGTEKWKVGTSYGISGTPVIGNDGTIYVATNKLRAFYPNGTLKWSFDFVNRYAGWSSPAISADGTIYIGVEIGNMAGGEIIAINYNGTERWRKKISDAWVDSSPSIGEDGTVYIGSTFETDRGYIHAFGPVESNSPPEAPSISGTINGAVGEEYWYRFRAVDPDNNPVSYYVDWGDGTSGWVGTRASDEVCYFSHEWTEKGTYNISAKVKDTLGEVSPWGYLEVTMPMNQQTTSSSWWFMRFLQNHPRMFPILRQLLGLN